MKKTYRRSGVLATLVATGAIGLAACSGSSKPDAASSPTVASLGTSSSNGGISGSGNGRGASSTSPQGGNATQLMDEWATCMRAHGDPNQTDPTIDQYGVINITMSNVSAALSSEVHGSSGPCSGYELAAENVLRAAHPVAPPPTQAQLLQYVGCMRTHGVPNMPDPGPNGESDFNAAGVDPNSASFENADKICSHQINAPAWWIAGTGPPGDVSVGTCNGSASFCSGPPPSGANRRGGGGGNSGSGANG
jgi:hypothetical protein